MPIASIAGDNPKLTTLPAQEADQIGKLRAVAVGVLSAERYRRFAAAVTGNYGS